MIQRYRQALRPAGLETKTLWKCFILSTALSRHAFVFNVFQSFSIRDRVSVHILRQRKKIRALILHVKIRTNPGLP